MRVHAGAEACGASARIAGVSVGEVRASDGTTIIYDVLGGGRPLMFVHGLASRRQAWDPITDELATEFLCIRVDLRGHGASSPAPAYSLPSLVGDVRAVVEQLALGEPPLIVGNSLGGMVAAVYAAVFPTRGVIVVDQLLRWGDFATLIAPFAERLRGEACMEAVLEIERILGVDFSPGDEFERRVRAFSPEVVRGVWDAVLSVPAPELTARAEALLPNITAPLVSLHGGPPPGDYDGWLRGLVRNAVTEIWDGAGHLLHLTERERFVARVRALDHPT
jgi:pimeloyl-ACP methyl ester carboxylesterase